MILSEELVDKLNLSALLNIVGAEGLYQQRLAFYNSVLNFFMSFIILTAPFVYYLPKYYIYTDPSRTEKRESTKDQALKNNWGFIKVYDRESFIKKFDREFSNDHYLGKIMVFVNTYVSVVGIVILVALSYLGRRWSYPIALTMAAVGSLCAFFKETIKITSFGIATMNCAYEIYFALSIAHASESIGGKLRDRVPSYSFFAFSLGAIFFYTVNKFIRGYRHIYLMIVIPCIVALFFYPFVIKESPDFYFGMKNYEKVTETLLKISEINGAGNKAEIKAKIVQTISLLKKIKPRNSSDIKFTKFLWPIIALSTILGNINFVYLVLAYTPQLIPAADISVNGILLTLVETFTYLCMIFFSEKCPRRLVSAFCSGFFVLAAFLILAIDLMKPKKRRGWKNFQVILCLLVKCALCVNFSFIANYFVEVFPSQYRGLAFTFSFLFGRIFSLSVGYITEFADSHDIIPLFGIIPFSMFAFFCVLTLPETLKTHFYH